MSYLCTVITQINLFVKLKPKSIMGNIVLQTQSRNVNGEERLTTSRVNYSTIGSDLICARIAQTSNIKVTTG